MGDAIASLRDMDDRELAECLAEGVTRERRATARVVAMLAEFDVRRLYLAHGFSSLFDYCTRHLHLSERAAGSRIAAARLSRRFPVILQLIEDSSISLTAVTLLGKHLNESNHRALLDEARHKTAGEVERIIVRLAPQPDAVPLIRRMPQVVQLPAAAAPRQPTVVEVTQRPAPPPSLPAGRASLVKPLSPERYKVQFTITEDTRHKLIAAKDLLRHSLPDGDLGRIFDRALSALLADLERRKLALVATPKSPARSPKPGTRVIPASVKRDVWRRDKGRCAFVGSGGRCRERGHLEFHHVIPFARGGTATVGNIQLRCRAHNSYEAELFER